jgi:Holliday junction resolvase-like predicted endonuclease
MFNLQQYQALIQAVDQAIGNHQKGATFEALSAYLFESLDGVEVAERNINLPTEEIDLLIWNARLEEVLTPWDQVILVECKNWSGPVGAATLRTFLHKVHEMHLKTGIFVAANGVTGDFVNGNNVEIGAAKLLHDALIRDNIRVIVVRMDDMRNIANVDALRQLIKSRYCKIYMHKVF